MPVIGLNAPAMRNKVDWDVAKRHARMQLRPQSMYVQIHIMPKRENRNDPQITWDHDGNIVVPGVGIKITRGVVLVDILDVDNANYNGWFVQPRATKDDEREQGLIRVCRL